jgi:hypothetical protein
MPTGTSEKGLKTLIFRHMTGTDGLSVAVDSVAKLAPSYGGSGYIIGSSKNYDRAHAIDVKFMLLNGGIARKASRRNSLLRGCSHGNW